MTRGVEATPQAVGVTNVVAPAVGPSHLEQIKTVLGQSIEVMIGRLSHWTGPKAKSTDHDIMREAIGVYQAVSPVALKHLELMGSGPGRIEVVDLSPVAPAPAFASSVEIEEITFRSEPPPS